MKRNKPTSTTFFWNACARALARPAVTDWLIRRALRTPYTHITSPAGEVYMERYWLFNAYPPESSGKRAWWKFPISIRLHCIKREDEDRHLHDHPWNARTIILRGGYDEIRLLRERPLPGSIWEWELRQPNCRLPLFRDLKVPHTRCPGDTAALRFGEYHRITRVTDGGVWTLFITGRYRGTWGFLVDGVKKPWRQYLGLGPKV